ADSLHVWDFAGKKLIAVIPAEAWALTPDARTLVTLESVHVDSGKKDALERRRPVVRVRDTRNWKSLEDYAVNGFHPAAAAFSRDRKHLVSTGGNRVIVWDVRAGKVVAEREGLSVNPSFLTSKGEPRLACPKEAARPAFVTFPDLKDAAEMTIESKPIKLP